MAFQNRWIVTAKLKTSTPLHLGTGAVTHRSGMGWLERRDPNDRVVPVDINAVAVDCEEAACVPGTAIKGVLRGWAKSYLQEHETDVDALFGKMEWGGRAEFHDARIEDELPQGLNPGRAWLRRRATCVASNVSIDRRLRTAVEDKLFHSEYVPPGVTFTARIAGRGWTTEQAALLVYLLDRLGDSDAGIRLGAGSNDGWGQVEVSDLRVGRMNAGHAAAWLAFDGESAGWEGVKDPQYCEDVTAQVRQAACRLAPTARTTGEVKLHLTLVFDYRFLVNDSSRTGKLSDNLPSQAPLQEYSGAERPLLPASSIRGAFRSQAEKILRTLGHEGPSTASQGISSYDDYSRLHLIEKIFGAPGWRAPIRFSDFKMAEGSSSRRVSQEFVAVDRFTGGAADSKKFCAKSFEAPHLTGSITIDTVALEKCGAGRWALGLLLYTLRDLKEGDIPLGFGASKGYGHCRVKTAWLEAGPPGADETPLGRALRAALPLNLDWSEDHRQIVEPLTTALHETLAAAGGA